MLSLCLLYVSKKQAVLNQQRALLPVELLILYLKKSEVDQTGMEISVISPEVFSSLGPDVKHEFSNQISINKVE